jgi:DNA-3-methyladenine glycosylase II
VHERDVRLAARVPAAHDHPSRGTHPRVGEDVVVPGPVVAAPSFRTLASHRRRAYPPGPRARRLALIDFTIEPDGPFTLASAARFIAGWPPAGRGEEPARADAVVRLAFLVDDWSGHAGVLLRQDSSGAVHGEVIEATARDAARIRAQAARVVSLDHDGTGYAALGERDAVVGALQRESGWLRPVLFHSPYEAACWAVISLRLRQQVAARLRDRLCGQHGGQVTVDGVELLTFPAPERLLDVAEVDGLPEEKLRRLHGIARAALEGRLDRERLLALDPEAAVEELLELRGIGPFWARGVFLRAVGPTDAVILTEPRMRRAAADRYGEPEVVEDDDAFLALAQRWRPFRTWVAVLLRAAT